MTNFELINKVAYGFIDEKDESWQLNIHRCDWMAGVGLYGMCMAHEKTGNKEIGDFLKKWVNMHFSELKAEPKINTMCLYYPVLYLYEKNHDECCLAECVRAADYMINDAPKTREGALEHTVIEADGCFAEQMWADTLFMAVLFIAKLGKYNKKYLDFAKEQLLIHLKYLRDDKSGLFFHAWNCESQNHMSAVHWGRANAWIIYSASEIASILGGEDGKYIAEKYIEPHCAALKKLQRGNGAFGTILDDGTAYDEASATAGITAGIKKAVQSGLVSDEYDGMCRKGTKYLIGCINNNGGVENVSFGTPVLENAQKYKDIFCTPSLYGQGLAATALCLNN